MKPDPEHGGPQDGAELKARSHLCGPLEYLVLRVRAERQKREQPAIAMQQKPTSVVLKNPHTWTAGLESSKLLNTETTRETRFDAVPAGYRFLGTAVARRGRDCEWVPLRVPHRGVKAGVKRQPNTKTTRKRPHLQLTRASPGYLSAVRAATQGVHARARENSPGTAQNVTTNPPVWHSLARPQPAHSRPRTALAEASAGRAHAVPARPSALALSQPHSHGSSAAGLHHASASPASHSYNYGFARLHTASHFLSLVAIKSEFPGQWLREASQRKALYCRTTVRSHCTGAVGAFLTGTTCEKTHRGNGTRVGS